jgi:hypothetical protein
MRSQTTKAQNVLKTTKVQNVLKTTMEKAQTPPNADNAPN